MMYQLLKATQFIHSHNVFSIHYYIINIYLDNPPGHQAREFTSFSPRGTENV